MLKPRDPHWLVPTARALASRLVAVHCQEDFLLSALYKNTEYAKGDRASWVAGGQSAELDWWECDQNCGLDALAPGAVCDGVVDSTARILKTVREHVLADMRDLFRKRVYAGVRLGQPGWQRKTLRWREFSKKMMSKLPTEANVMLLGEKGLEALGRGGYEECAGHGECTFWYGVLIVGCEAKWDVLGFAFPRNGIVMQCPRPKWLTVRLLKELPLRLRVTFSGMWSFRSLDNWRMLR